MSFKVTLISAGTLLLVCRLLIAGHLGRARRLRRKEFIRSYVFPASALAGLVERHPHLSEEGQLRVAQALRDFFLVRLRVGNRLIGMPSRVADDLWHEFILDTREYERFCKAAFRGFFHHVPAAANPPGRKMDAALRMTWRCACFAEGIQPLSPAKLPLLFRIDSELQIANGQSFINWLLAPPRTKHAEGGGCSSGDSHSGGCGGHGGCSGGCGGH